MDRSSQRQHAEKWLRKVKTPTPLSQRLYVTKREKSKSFRMEESLSSMKSSKLPRQASIRKCMHAKDHSAQDQLQNYTVVRKRAKIIEIVDSDEEEERAMFITQLPKKGKKDHGNGHQSSRKGNQSSLSPQTEKDRPDALQTHQAQSNNSESNNVTDSTDDEHSLFITQVPRSKCVPRKCVPKATAVKGSRKSLDHKSKTDSSKCVRFCFPHGQGNNARNKVKKSKEIEPTERKKDIPQHGMESPDTPCSAGTLGSPVVARMMREAINKDAQTDNEEYQVIFLYY